ncbi:hypothetical protein AJ78_02745 [Emergomyces pasteurianus Ep9510]|uniref:Uncharacterized protein n=1 Tax=Emergomyces pasteurianus Ep9510 TaxID=1447872 RepID=A0A1J9QLU2_9EURO|nr:hypothetical protein AJ78_02745 [Emergomyces pasteurianus Ep9510]
MNTTRSRMLWEYHPKRDSALLSTYYKLWRLPESSPMASKVYQLSQIQDAMSAKHGQHVTLNCKHDQLDEHGISGTLRAAHGQTNRFSTGPAHIHLLRPPLYR